MSLYPLYLQSKVALERLAIDLHIVHPPHLIPRVSPVGWPLKGLNARYRGGDDGSPTNIVVRSGVTTGAQLNAILATGVRTIALVETLDGDIVREVGGVAQTNPPNLLAIELGNEIDLTGVSSATFSKFLESSYTTLRSVYGFRGDIISGGVSMVRPDTLSWLKSSLSGVAPEVLVGIHRYSIDNDATIPQDGYVNRDDESNAILEVSGSRGLAFTEFGYPLLDGFTAAQLGQAVESTQVDLETFTNLGAKYATYYQWLNGTTNTPIDRFGVQHQPEILSLLTN